MRRNQRKPRPKIQKRKLLPDADEIPTLDDCEPENITLGGGKK